MRRASFVFTFTAVSLASAAAFATVPRHAPQPDVVPMGRSVGSPTSGHLVGGARLEDEPYLRVMPADRAGDVRWGLGSLVGMIDRAARRVRHMFPGAVLNVGHISKRGGGNIEMHASHESGRDADLPFYVDDAHGKQVFSEHMVPFRGDGTSAAWPGAHFDDAKNWALVAALLEDPVARVTHIFVSSPIRARLLAYAAHAGAAEALRTRAAFTMVQPRGTLPHDDHFHVRIGCPDGMRGCVENPAAHFARRGAHGRRHGHEAPPRAQEETHGAEPRSTATPNPTPDREPAAAIVEGDGG